MRRNGRGGRGSRNGNGNGGQNEHIPSFIRNRPWYVGQQQGNAEAGGSGSGEEDYLAHHRLGSTKQQQPGKSTGIQDAFSYVRRSGGGPRCENCGGHGHLKRDCLERPKKRGTSGTGGTGSSGDVVRVRDESVIEADYDAKRDRWYGYVPDIDELERKHAAARSSKQQQQQQQQRTMDEIQRHEMERLKLAPQDLGFDAILPLDAEKYNPVRSRDDRAAYLQDMDAEETLYDPKSRIYKSKEDGTIDPKSNMFRRHLTGDALQVGVINEKVRQEALKSGVKDFEVNKEKLNHVFAANPTKYELLMRSETGSESSSKGSAGSESKNSTDQTQDEQDQQQLPKRRRVEHASLPSNSQMKDLYDKYM
ncbi:mRNA splicing protein [Kluyveromyces marxianus]|nr:mRNA splicing protein [Kluyveromyces marxianus]KAG0685684.1 mRNA splicing protein [Kluyveromyces marxianus]